MFFIQKIQLWLWDKMLTKKSSKFGFYFSGVSNFESFKSKYKNLKSLETQKHTKKSGIAVSPENVLLIKDGDKKRMNQILNYVLSEDSSDSKDLKIDFSDEFQKLILIGRGWGALDSDGVTKSDGVKKYIFKNGKIILWIPRISSFELYLNSEQLRPFSMLWFIF